MKFDNAHLSQTRENDIIKFVVTPEQKIREISENTKIKKKLISAIVQLVPAASGHRVNHDCFAFGQPLLQYR